jgi:hypothetical protein
LTIKSGGSLVFERSSGGATPTLNGLVLDGGSVSAWSAYSSSPKTPLSVQNLVWKSGSLGYFNQSSSGSAPSVDASVVNAELYAGELGNSSKLTIKGTGRWLDGGSYLKVGTDGQLNIAAGAELRDEGQTAREIGGYDYTYLNNQGTYRKTGSGESTLRFENWNNAGLFRVENGSLLLTVTSRYGGTYANTGRVEVAGGSLRIGSTSYGFDGQVAVSGGGQLSFAAPLWSKGTWQIGTGSKVSFDRGGTSSSGLYSVNLGKAGIRNDGVLHFEGSELVLPATVAGGGTLELEGSKLAVDGHQVIENSLALADGVTVDERGQPNRRANQLLLDITSASVFDSLEVGGVLTLDGNLDMTFTDGLKTGSWQLVDAASVLGRFEEVHLLCGNQYTSCNTQGYAWGLSYGPDSITLNVSAVPEPGALAMAGLGLGLVAVRRRRMAAR